MIDMPCLLQSELGMATAFLAYIHYLTIKYTTITLELKQSVK